MKFLLISLALVAATAQQHDNSHPHRPNTKVSQATSGDYRVITQDGQHTSINGDLMRQEIRHLQNKAVEKHASAEKTEDDDEIVPDGDDLIESAARISQESGVPINDVIQCLCQLFHTPVPPLPPAAPARQAETNFLENALYYVYRWSLPGYTKKDIHVKMTKSVLDVNAEHKGKNFMTPLHISFELPADALKDKKLMKAGFKNEVLTVTIPKNHPANSEIAPGLVDNHRPVGSMFNDLNQVHPSEMQWVTFSPVQDSEASEHH